MPFAWPLTGRSEVTRIIDPIAWRSPGTVRALTSPTTYDSTVSLIDTATDTVITTIDTGDAAWGVAVSADGTRA